MPAGSASHADASTMLFAARRSALPPELSMVIPCHNRGDLLRACLASVIRHAPTNTEVIVVDDASPEGVASAAAADFAGVRAIRLRRQSGFCVAANVGIRAARHPIVELLNDDTEVTAGWAEAALGWFRNPGVGALAPLVLCWPGGDVGTARIDSAGDRYYRGGVAGKRARGTILQAAHLTPRRVFGASASSAFYRRELLVRFGGFPESFGAYFEDVDLAFRLHRAGYDVIHEPASRVLHHVSASHGRTDRKLLEQQSRNEERVFWRNLPAATILRALPAHFAVLAAKAARRCRQGTLLPFLRGRIQTFVEFTAILRHRRRLGQLGTNGAPHQWCIEEHYWG
jgi:GT2 family glycosyltransferase